MLNVLFINDTLSNKSLYLPVGVFDEGFLLGSSSKLIRLSPSLISSHRPTGNLK
jgi:hypothetical protein